MYAGGALDSQVSDSQYIRCITVPDSDEDTTALTNRDSEDTNIPSVAADTIPRNYAEDTTYVSDGKPGGDSKKAAASLMVRLDAQSKRLLVEAAELRHVSVSDYVRTVTVAQARREVAAASEHVLAMTPQEQLAFWTALQVPPVLTEPQRQLGRLMQGKL